MRMPPEPATTRTVAMELAAPDTWPWRSDAPDWRAAVRPISLATMTRIWMSRYPPPRSRRPLTWHQGARETPDLSAKLLTNTPLSYLGSVLMLASRILKQKWSHKTSACFQDLCSFGCSLFCLSKEPYIVHRLFIGCTNRYLNFRR